MRSVARQGLAWRVRGAAQACGPERPAAAGFDREAFRARVEANIEEARVRAFETLGKRWRPPRPRMSPEAWAERAEMFAAHAERFGPATPVVPVQGRRGFCKGCDCSYDEHTEWCPNCQARHGMRALSVERRSQGRLVKAKGDARERASVSGGCT